MLSTNEIKQITEIMNKYSTEKNNRDYKMKIAEEINVSLGIEKGKAKSIASILCR